jgi:hypothetical protein
VAEILLVPSAAVTCWNQEMMMRLEILPIAATGLICGQ